MRLYAMTLRAISGHAGSGHARRRAVGPCGWRPVLAACLAVGLAAVALGAARAQSGWAVSPYVAVPRVEYSVLGAQPGCGGRAVVAIEVRRAVEGFGLRTPDASSEPSRLARAVGDLLNTLGFETMNQDYAECAEVCAAIPLTATRVTSLLGYVTVVGGSAFVPVPFDRYTDLFHWEPEVDTTRVGADGRLVCVGVRNWGPSERTAFLVVGYE